MGSPLVFLIVVLVLIFWGFSSSPPSSLPSNNSDQEINTLDERPRAFVPTVMRYEQALQIYQNSRVQLNQNCRAIPGNVTFKNNTDIMIDNRASYPRIIRLGPSVFTLKAYDFTVVKITSATLPVTWFLSCDQSINVATILIQR